METDERRRTRIPELEALIAKHQDLYYNGKPELSDAEFDELWDELARLAPESPVLAGLGKDSSDGFPKARHVLPMGSQAKAADPDEFLAWCAKAGLPEYVVEHKLDGASLELQYERGRLARAVTRGDGSVGDDITQNARRMKGVPAALPEPWSGAVRGEVVMSRAAHRESFSDKANCRNAANGLMKRKDGLGVELLDVICYDAAPRGLYDAEPGSLFSVGARPPFDDEIAKLAWLGASGFSTVPAQVFAEPFEVVDYRARVMDGRDALPYDIDGLVVKARSVDIDDMRRARPDRQIAFKFPLEEASTTLVAVEWSESGATYTPVGIVEPVRLAGTTVRRASLANTNTMRGMGLRIGSRVVVVKRGEIIPKIEGLVESPPGSEEIAVPSTCSCGAALVDEGTRLYCPNAECPKKALHRLEKWLSTLDVMEFGVTILRRLFDSGRVRQVADLYGLSIRELSGYERMGEASAAKIVQNLLARAEPTLAEFVAGFDIEGIGLLSVEKAAAAGFDTLEKLRAATREQLAAIDGFGEIMAATLADGLVALGPQMDLALAGGALRVKPPAQSGGPLSGLSFCFTGELSTMKRSRAQAIAKSLGASVKSAVSKDLSYLVTNDPGSGSEKSKKAKALGVEVIDEAAFVAMISGAAPEA
ncbi:MAG: NAD-dependent DNA ligase LigA [Spirochaetes bacterium]|nr:NAD-dependent DNA ligase LigA [Spirochaetota bacterium]MBU1081387.1 NAD-dependent DNA ligase LigA [Spirochaetota bacterium]